MAKQKTKHLFSEISKTDIQTINLRELTSKKAYANIVISFVKAGKITVCVVIICTRFI